jgi:hypothetical protein
MFPSEVKETMKLSTAILKGAKLRPQGFGVMTAEEGTSCAIIAALEVTLGSYERAKDAYVEEGTERHFPVLNAENPPCPVSADCRGGGYSHLEGMIYHLNDDHHWTRERIAKWVRQFEIVKASSVT